MTVPGPTTGEGGPVASKEPAPLAGIRVIDATTRWGELAGRTLAELGAEVFKLEGACGSDAARVGPDAGPGSAYWACVRAGKRSVAEADVAPHLASADVLLESGRSGDYQARFPHLVHASITPFGLAGPMADAPAAELTVEAAGGLIGLQGDGDRPPLPMGAMPQAAFHAGVQAAADVAIALCERERSGLGQHLDVSAQACVVWTLMNATGYPPNTGANPPATSEFRREPHPAAAAQRLRLPGIVSCKNGLVQVRLQMRILGERTFDALLRWVEASELAVPPVVKGLNLMQWLADVRRGELDLDAAQQAADLIVALLATKTKQELQAYSAAHGLTLAAIHTVSDLLADPHLAARDFWQRVGAHVYAGPFARLSLTPLAPPRPAEAPGASALPPSGPLRRSAAARPPTAPFAGIKVADFSWVGVGPMIGKALADHGATVVRIESPERLDLLRTAPPFKDGEAGPDRAQFMANFNTSKRGMTIDLKNPAGQRLARRMADWADVVLESYSPGTMARFGLDWPTLAADREDLVMLSTSMRGQTGPERGYSGFGGQGDHRRPVRAGGLAGSAADRAVGRLHGFHHAPLRHRRPRQRPVAPAANRARPIHRPRPSGMRHPLPGTVGLGLRRHRPGSRPPGPGIPLAAPPRRVRLRWRGTLPGARRRDGRRTRRSRRPARRRIAWPLVPPPRCLRRGATAARRRRAGPRRAAPQRSVRG